MNDHLRPYLINARARIIKTSVFLIVQSIFWVLAPWPLKFFFDAVTYSPNFRWLADAQNRLEFSSGQMLLVFAAVFGGLALFGAIIARLEESSSAVTASTIRGRYQHDLLDRILRGKLSFFEKHSAQDLAARVSDDTQAIESLILTGTQACFRAVPTLALITILLFVLDARMSIAFALVAVPFVAVSVAYSRKLRTHLRRAKTENYYFREEVERTISQLPALKSLSLEEAALDELELRVNRASEHKLSSRAGFGSLLAFNEFAKNILRAAVVIWGGYEILAGKMSIGTVVLFFAYIEILPQAVLDIGRFLSALRSTIPLRDRLNALISTLDEQEETGGKQTTSPLPLPDAGVLRFSKVAWRDLRGELTSEFEPGELIAVVGPAQSGKTSLGRLLNRLEEPKKGSIAVGRTDLKRFSISLLRQMVTLIERNPFFLRTSIRNNLRFNSGLESDIDDQRLNEALHAAAVDFLGDLPNHLDTEIGPGAYQLSDVQAIKLHLAQAFLRDESKVFYFDDPTLDLETEDAESVFESIRALANQGAIVFWVTRRLDEAGEADRVLFLQKNRHPVVDKHESLLSVNEAYRRFLGLKPEPIRPEPGGDGHRRPVDVEHSH